MKHFLTIHGSKAYAQRVLIITALLNQSILLSNIPECQDVLILITALRALGAKISKIKKSIWRIKQIKYFPQAPRSIINLQGNGTAMRFLTTISALARGTIKLDGNERMRQRPIGELLSGLRQLTVNCFSQYNNNCPPVVVKANTVINGGQCEMSGAVSSQYFSSIMLSAPYAQGDVVIKVLGKLVSQDYVRATMELMKDFGVAVKNEGFKKFTIKSSKQYSFHQKKYRIEGDWAAAAYWFALAAASKKTVALQGLNKNSVQAEKNFLAILVKMGCQVKLNDKIVKLIGKKLTAVQVDGAKLVDAVQTLMTLTLLAQGRTIIYNIGNLRYKESDRISDMAHNLRKFSAEITESQAGIKIKGLTVGQTQALKTQPILIETKGDHRIAMSFAILKPIFPGIKIDDPDCVKKSYPNFWRDYYQMTKINF